MVLAVTGVRESVGATGACSSTGDRARAGDGAMLVRGTPNVLSRGGATGVWLSGGATGTCS